MPRLKDGFGYGVTIPATTALVVDAAVVTAHTAQGEPGRDVAYKGVAI
jgi:hypothetical protein